MGKYYGAGGSRIGKVGAEVYEIKNGTNIVRLKNSYIPVNNAWIKREEFKEYVLSLLEVGIPQIYVLDELPEKLYPYALLFVKNKETRDIYVDKDFTRTKINIGEGGGGNYDAVNVVENLPQNPEENVIYYTENKINEQRALKKGLRLEEQKSYIYVCEDEEIKQVIPNVDYIAEEQMVFKNKTIKGEDNTVQNLIPEECIKPGYILNKIEESKQYYGFVNLQDPNDIIFTDNNTLMALVYVYKAKVKDGMITEIISKSTDQVYYYGAYITYEGTDYFMDLELDQVYPILDKSIVYTQTIKTYVDDKTQPINDLTSKSLKNVYNTILPANKNVITDANGYLTTVDHPHLYLHHYRFLGKDVASVQILVYSYSNTELTLQQLGEYLYGLGCTSNSNLYPATGIAMHAPGIVFGLYVTRSGTTTYTYTFMVAEYVTSKYYYSNLTSYSNQKNYYIYPIF